ncbi:MAG: choice-of-anchor O protein, partial [Anaerolineae bacterium]
MKIKTMSLALLVIMLVSSLAFADDGAYFVKNVSGTPDLETERANMAMMNFYVPMQNANGRLLVEGEDTATMYYTDYPGDDAQKVLYETRGYAKPLVSVYIDALPEEHEEVSIMSGGAGIGAHDAYASFSLDDGHTWKATNLSNSAHLTSFTLANGTPFPGDAHNMTFAIADDKVLVGWISKYCADGNPAYRFQAEDIVALQTAYGLPDLYVHDIWGVNGKQGSVDYTDQGFPEVGEIPYSCVWAARGQLVPTTLTAEETPGYEIVWLDAERLTSGQRDANRLEMAADAAAGFMMTWQEDPEGLRPGLGLGPGEGWSGAIVHQDTDLWYSFIKMEHFDLVVDMGAEPVLTEAIPLADFVAQLDAGTLDGKPTYAVPMAVPMRLTDNDKCMSNG